MAAEKESDLYDGELIHAHILVIAGLDNASADLYGEDDNALEYSAEQPSADDAQGLDSHNQTHTNQQSNDPRLQNRAPNGTQGLSKTQTSAEADALSYSAQIAQQFSAYRQTPTQERQPFQQQGTSAIATYESPISSSHVQDKLPPTDRPVRPSEMKDEG